MLIGALLAALAVAAVACSSEPEVVEKIVEVTPTPDPKETIIFSDLNWTSAQLQNRIAQYIVEKGYSYPTDVVFGATLPLLNGLRAGDTHVTMEIWLPNQEEAWVEAQAEGQVVSVGESLGRDWQSAFVIPAYLQEQYPDLDSVEDLKDDQYKKLFATAATGGKARLVSCVIGWVCEEVNAAQITGYGLDDHVHIVNPGDGASANADLYGAYEKQEPWLGYQWGTNDPPLLLDLVRLEEPAYSDECWSTTKACAYQDATIVIAVGLDILSRAPDVVAMLRNWGFNLDRYKTVAAWQSENSEGDGQRRRSMVAQWQRRHLARMGNTRGRCGHQRRAEHQRGPRRLADRVGTPASSRVETRTHNQGEGLSPMAGVARRVVISHNHLFWHPSRG